MLTEKNSLASNIPNHWKPEAWVDRDVYGENQRDGKAWARMYKSLVKRVIARPWYMITDTGTFKPSSNVELSYRA